MSPPLFHLPPRVFQHSIKDKYAWVTMTFSLETPDSNAMLVVTPEGIDSPTPKCVLVQDAMHVC